MSRHLDPDAARLLARRNGPPLHTLTPEQARSTRSARTPADRDDDVGTVEELTLPLSGRAPAARRYLPGGAAPPGTVVFFHGGGFVTGDLDSHDRQARMLCTRTGWAVVSIDYRLAPEHPFPAAVDDAVESVARIARDAGPVAVAGSSAGGNLAAGAARALAGTPGAPVAQLLVQPLLTDDPGLPARRDNAAAPGLDDATLRWYLRHYLGPRPGARRDPRFDLLAEPPPDGLAPAVVAVGGVDPLRDDGWSYARALATAGVEVVLHDHPRLPHGLWGMAGDVPAADRAAAAFCDAFTRLLHRSTDTEEH
ncbi:hypothetical protein AD006_25150 [Pseudonocardia sp. EC080610-09]|uniref:alpha/beta hydrolase n=1 Tax=unclassified Pseudonocardia TaxID=2619320 RepID=UPI000706541E|nr:MULTISPECIES: alpha/beta hydrolase [unclassified Pseudonocardia]ALL77772.1 hypothetical protein AD006_25150 [Pseudonocardia sp. EC080610-09]ALL80687.1 hypothetical protein AD017_04740 [Pseudonocardia sp. EC080619-01]